MPVKDPVAQIGISLGDGVFGVRPCSLDLLNELLLCVGGALLQRLAPEGEVLLQLRDAPVVIRSDDVVVPVLLDEVLEVPSVRRRRVRDVIVREPAIQLCFMPLVVRWEMLVTWRRA
jgi:hypothetical protein